MEGRPLCCPWTGRSRSLRKSRSKLRGIVYGGTTSVLSVDRTEPVPPQKPEQAPGHCLWRDDLCVVRGPDGAGPSAKAEASFGELDPTRLRLLCEFLQHNLAVAFDDL